MPSPFPGMNPWLERSANWRSFHTNFIVGCQHYLVPLLRPRYIVDLESRLYLHTPGEESRYRGSPDATILAPTRPVNISAAPSAVIEAPSYVTYPDPVEVETVHYLMIRDRPNMEVITTIEVLSRANKYAGEDRDDYLRKRLEVMKSASHFVEIDLLRGGPRMPPDDLPTCDYCAVVSRVEERPRMGVWSWRLRDPIPAIPIPLRSPDADVLLDIKAVIDRVYDLSGLADIIYDGPPQPRLSPDDMAWAAAFLPSPSA